VLSRNRPPEHSLSSDHSLLSSYSFELSTNVGSIHILPQHPITLHALSRIPVINLSNLTKSVIRSISFDCRDLVDGFRDILSRKQWRALLWTMYKRKGKKILPRNIPLPSGKTPGGDLNQKMGEIVEWKIGDGVVGGGKGKIVPRGSRLTKERLKKMNIGGGMLKEKEIRLFEDILFEYEGALAFDDDEMGLLNPEIEPPVEIPTVPHEPWQQQNLRLPKAMQEEANRIIRAQLKAGNYEFSQGPYRGRYFLVEKKQPGTWRLVNDVQPLNGVTIRDSGMPPAVDEFSEDFAGYPITSAIDYYSGYYQIPLAATSRDLTAFLTFLGLLRVTRLPQGWTNSVAIFQRVMGKVHWRQIPEFVRPFLDDLGVKGPKDRYGDEEIEPGIRRFVYEHALIIRQFLHDAWVAGLTISGKKSMIGMSGIALVGFLCDADGRRPDPEKTKKILDWPIPRNTKEARGFIGLAVYYRMFIKGFSLIAIPIFNLFRKGQRFQWTPECQLSMDDLKHALSTAPVIISLDYSPSALGIVLQTDASTIGWGGVLAQYREDGQLHPARFESGIWSDAEKKYDAVRLECRGLLKLLKKFRFWVYGRHFFIQTDSRTLVWILNQPPNDLPNAMMTRWLSYIRLFDFDVEHINGKRNGAADGLSRRGIGKEEEIMEEEDPDDFFEAKVGNVVLEYDFGTLARVFLVESEYSGDDLMIGKYLETLERPPDLTDTQFQQLRKKSRDFLVRDGFLFKRGRKKGIPPRRVVGLEGQRLQLIKEVHDEIGHRGRRTTFEHLARRYQWKGMYADVDQWIKTCEICQRRARNWVEEPLHPTWTSTVWEKIGVDVVYMPIVDGIGFIVFARDDLSGWVEGKALEKVNSENVSKFIYEEVICRHGCPQRMVLDGGSENLDLTKALLERYKIRKMVISSYHAQSNGLVERGHSPIVNSLAKFCKQRKTDNWIQFLPLVLWADRISVRRTTGYSAFEMVYGRECLLPVQLSIASWSTVDWDSVKTREDLIMARMQQLDQYTLERDQAAENLINSRKANKSYFDQDKRIRSEKLEVGDLVLLLISKDQFSRARAKKLVDKWCGPYQIYEAPEDSTFYRLEELDGVKLTESFAGNRLKKFYLRKELQEHRDLRDQALKEMDDVTETDQRRFAERHAERLEELNQMAGMAKR